MGGAVSQTILEEGEAAGKRVLVRMKEVFEPGSLYVELQDHGLPEQPILNQFFTASRLRDNTSLANFAMVAFEPNTQGIIISFDITNVTPEQRRPLGLRTLAKAHQDAEAEDERIKTDTLRKFQRRP